MATQTVEFQAVTGQSVTAKLFAVGSDTQVASVSATEATNRKGTYSAAYTDVAAGTYDLIAFVSTTPVARWQVVLTLTTATFQAYEPIATGPIADAVWDEPMADHTASTSYGGRIVRAANSNVTVQITGANHIAADVHEFQADAIDADAIATSAVTELQAGLALQSSLTTLISYVDTEVAAIKAKTDNLPSDPADASDIAASFSAVNSTLATIAAYIDTEIAAIKAKTDNLPSDPADQSAVEAAITSATSALATAASLASIASELAKVHKQGETRRFTQVARDALNKTADVTMGAPL